jgi:hypothetical protein
LRSALDLFKHGGHVSPSYQDQVFRLHFDNKRRIIDEDIRTSMQDVDIRILMSEENCKLFDSEPLNDANECKVLRAISQLPKKRAYQRLTSTSGGSKYKSNIELAVRNFLKVLFNNEMNLDSNQFTSYKDIIEFLNGFYESIEGLDGFESVKRMKFSENYIAQIKARSLKNRIRKVVPKTLVTIKFVDYVRIKFPGFEDNEFFK